MTYTYHHTFTNGTKAKALIGDEPLRFEVEWDGPKSSKLFQEYCRWRQTIIDDFAKRIGKKIVVLDIR